MICRVNKIDTDSDTDPDPEGEFEMDIMIDLGLSPFAACIPVTCNHLRPGQKAR